MDTTIGFGPETALFPVRDHFKVADAGWVRDLKIGLRQLGLQGRVALFDAAFAAGNGKSGATVFYQKTDFLSVDLTNISPFGSS